MPSARPTYAAGTASTDFTCARALEARPRHYRTPARRHALLLADRRTFTCFISLLRSRQCAWQTLLPGTLRPCIP